MLSKGQKAGCGGHVPVDRGCRLTRLQGEGGDEPDKAAAALELLLKAI
jgi:hypothetical protein